MIDYSLDDLVNPLILNGVFFAKETGSPLISILFIVLSLLGCGTSSSI